MTIAGVGMQDDLKRMDSISQNIANVLTPGYKKQAVVVSPFNVQLVQAGAEARLAGVPGAAPRLALDAGAGTLRPSASAQDVAIEGESFFEVATPAGPAYTRQGALRADVQGRLVGSQGLPLQGEGGDISLTGAPFKVAANGDVTQGERIVGRLKRVRFEQAGAMVAQGNGLYGQGGAILKDARATDPVRAGFQESSNVNSPQEMVRMTDTVRHFEALSRLVQGYDDTLEKTIRKLGDF